MFVYTTLRKGKSKSLQIADHIGDLMAKNFLMPEMRLPPVREMAKLF